MSSSASIGLGILSWRARKTLRASLQSHRDAGLFGLFDEVVIFFNEVEEEDRALAAEFGLRAEGAGEKLVVFTKDQRGSLEPPRAFAKTLALWGA